MLLCPLFKWSNGGSKNSVLPGSTIRSQTQASSLQICSFVPRPSLRPKGYCPTPFEIAFSFSKQVAYSCFPSLFAPFSVFPWLPTLLVWMTRDRTSSANLRRPNVSLCLYPNLAWEHGASVRSLSQLSSVPIQEMAIEEVPVLLFSAAGTWPLRLFLGCHSRSTQ